MLQYVRGSYAWYKEALEQKRKVMASAYSAAAQRKRAQQGLVQLKSNKAKREQESGAESCKIQSEISELKKQLKEE